MALHRAGKADAERLYRVLQRRMRDELLNESLFFGLDHARSAIAEWAGDYNHSRPHSSLGYQTPARYAGTIAATGSNAAQDEGYAFPPVAPTAPSGVSKTAEALLCSFASSLIMTLSFPALRTKARMREAVEQRRRQGILTTAGILLCAGWDRISVYSSGAASV
ncbi:integrase core domain-containing protein [Sinorhizobium meliloti]|uniref:integrase core domain-containing protein n=1 Tax=Rhizobium meliloti TaxID=382 RepID=UPI001F39168C|nr:transposase [Sinorhizobium meliloti]